MAEPQSAYLFHSGVIYRQKLYIDRDLCSDLVIDSFLQGLKLGRLHTWSVQLYGASLTPQLPATAQTTETTVRQKRSSLSC